MNEPEWRYEVRGSFVYDLVTDENLDLTQTAARLQETFVRAGEWAVKAGLLQSDVERQQAEIRTLRTALRSIHELALTRQSVAEIGRRADAALQQGGEG